MKYLLLSCLLLLLGCKKNTVTSIAQMDFKMPNGFKINVFADSLANARSLAQAPNGTIFVGTRNAGKVYALKDENNDGIADKRWTIATGLHMPNGVAFKQGNLFVAEIDKLWRFDNILSHLDNPPKPTLIYTFPTDEWHGWKFIRFSPDGYLYIPVGAPCNVCNAAAPYSRIHRIKTDGTGFETMVEGMRNTVGFDWHPITKNLYFTDNGRDLMGDTIPNDELNRVQHKNEHFGFPFVHAGDILDPDFGKGKKISDYTPPVQKLGAHVAALGMRFYTGNLFPESYKNRIFIAEHGSWNSSHKVGYKVSMINLTAKNAAQRYLPFIEGFLQKDGSGNETVLGRPVDLEVLPDGSMLLSDDFANRIYRITYKK